MQTLGDAGKYRTAVGARLITDGDDVWEKLPALENIEDALRFLFGNIDADFAHRFDRDRIERAGFKSGAVRIELPATKTVQPRLGHLAAGAVMNANKQYFLFHPFYIAAASNDRVGFNGWFGKRSGS